MLEVRVERKALVSQDAAEFELRSLSGGPLPPFSAGSHIDVEVAQGVTRQYSLCNDPAERHRYVIGVLRDEKSRGGSSGMHDGVHADGRITISEPRNLFPLVEGPHRSLLFAGGIGVTPLLSMAERLSSAGAPFVLHYCCRTRARAAFDERIRRSRFADRVSFHFDDEGEGQALRPADVLADEDRSSHVYVCGPAGFIEAVLRAARAHGWGEANLHCESFSAQPQTRGGDAAFEVRLAASGRSITVLPGETVVRALAEAGVAIEVSCEQGVCGTCVTRVLAGEPDHRDMYLTPDEQAANDQFTPCCSRSRTPVLVLDL